MYIHCDKILWIKHWVTWFRPHGQENIWRVSGKAEKGETVINSLEGAFTLGTSLILCYRSPRGITYIPHARDILSIRLLLTVYVILVDITEPKQKQHTHQNPCIYNHSLLSHVWLLATPRTAAHQASLSFTISWSLLKFMSFESVMLSSHVVLCHSLLLLSSIFSSELALCISGQSTGASASAWVLPMNIQGWCPL